MTQGLTGSADVLADLSNKALIGRQQCRALNPLVSNCFVVV